MENDPITAPVIEPADMASAGEEPVIAPALLVEELLVEEISIDGMCGVY